MELLDGVKIKNIILDKIKNKVDNLDLSLAVIKVGNDKSSEVYLRQKEKMCKYLNIKFKEYIFDNDAKEEDIINLIKKLNKDKTTGIFVEMPLPKHLNELKIINTIDYRKDVDGLTKINVANLVLNDKGLIPCTPKGIITLLDYYNIDLDGKNVTILGRSNVVGKPLSTLLLNRNATVCICHSKTKNIKDYSLGADIVISALGKPKFVTKDLLKKGCIVVDVGISLVNNEIFGDVDFENVKNKVSYITPVPGGVGPMTIASLALNIYEAYLLQKD